MSDPSGDHGQSLWQALRQRLGLRQRGSLRESIEEAFEEHAGERDGGPDDLDQAERAMLRNMLLLSERRVGEIAVQRTDIVAVAEDSDFASLVRAFAEGEHSRLPAYRGSLDEVVGMLLVKDVYAVLAGAFLAGTEPTPPATAAMIRPVLFVPPSMPVVDLLGDMRRKRTHMAVVVDEYGGTDGLVTIEDIIEEIVGEIEDEHDEAEERMLLPEAGGTFLVDARIALDDLETELGTEFLHPDIGDEVDTLGGLAFLMAGHVPAAGDVLVHPNGWRLEIVASDGRRIERLRLVPPGDGADEATG